MTEAINLGALMAYAGIDSAQFDRAFPVLVRRFSQLGKDAGDASLGVAKLDTTLAGVAESSSAASASLTRSTTATTRQAAAGERAAAAAKTQSDAEARLAATMDTVAGSSKAEQVATLRAAAANERAAVAAGRGNAAYARLASTQASAIAATQRLERVQTTAADKMATAGKKMSTGVTLPAVAAAAVSVKLASDFQKSTNVYVTAAGESEKNLATVRDGIKNVAAETGTSIDKLTSAEYLAQKAGLRGAAGIKVLDAAAKGAREEGADLSDVMQAMTSVMASYHLPASQAVQVMNALKTGAGQAKVTMEDFAGSLSTVIPIASANKIAIQEVLGAEATLTQHGTSAKEATQELASTIRALVAPNRAAQAQMQQLGLDVNDVTKNIGKRGLTGTVQLLVDTTIKHMGPAGLVIQDAMNKSASAAQDANAMLAKMPAQVKTVAESYRSGKLSLGDWRAELKAMPADQAALAKQWQTLEDKSKGFNQLLRSGDPAAQTFTAALKKMGGGAIGLNTILQLSGENMDGFKGRTDAVGKSLHDSAKDVEGWSSTSKLLGVRADMLKQSLHVLAIDAGTALIPMLDKLVGKGRAVVGWFQDLSHTQKVALGWSVGVLAALGPVLSIGTKLGAAGKGLATFAGAAEATATRVGLATQRIAGALAGIGLVYAGTQTGGTAGHIMGALGGAATGAAIGSFFSPIGTAVGTVVGAVAGLGATYLKSGHAASKASKEARAALAAQKQDAEDLLGVLKETNGAYGETYRAALAQKLQKSGAFDLASKAGVSPSTVVQAAMGNTDAAGQLKALEAQLQKQVTVSKKNVTLGPNGELNVNITPAIAKAQDQAAALYSLLKILGNETPAAKQAEKAFEQFQAAMGSGIVPTKQLADYQHNLAKELKNTGTSLDVTTAFGAKNTEVVKENLGYLQQQAVKQVASGKSAKDAARDYQYNVQALEDQLVKLGFNRDAVAKLIAIEGKIPASVLSKINADPKPAKQAVREAQAAINSVRQGKVPGIDADSSAGRAVIGHFQSIINALKGKTVGIGATVYGAQSVHRLAGDILALHDKTVTIRTVNTQGGAGAIKANAAGSRATYRRPDGTIPPNTTFTVGEDGWEGGVTDSQGRARIFSHAQAMALGFRAPVGYANGSTPSSVTKVSGGYRVGDTVYESKRAADNAARREATATAKATSKLTAQLRAAAATLGAGLQNHIAVTKTGALTGSVESPDDARSALSSTMGLLRQAGVPSKWVESQGKLTKKIIGEVKSRNDAATQLQKANEALKAAQDTLSSDRSAFTGAVTGSFDITSAGQDANGTVTKGSLEAAQAQNLTRVRLWVKDMNQLIGDKVFPDSYLRSLLGQGPSTLGTVQALVSMNAGELRDFAANEASLSSLASQVGSAGASRLDQPAVTKAQNTQTLWANREKTRQQNLDKTLKTLGDRVENIVGSLHLKTTISGRELAILVETGKAKAQKSARSNK